MNEELNEISAHKSNQQPASNPIYTEYRANKLERKGKEQQ